MKLRVPISPFTAVFSPINLLLATILLFSGLLQAQTRTVSGKVMLDVEGTPGIGVTVQVKDGNAGAVTNAEGRYSLAVPGPDAVLTFSFLGYLTQELTVGNSATLDVVLRENTEALQEVVVTALGIKKEKAKLGYAAQEIGGTVLQKAPEPNVATNLTGRVAGLAVFSKSTLYENPEITLRGQKTLVVIDGVPTETDFWNLSSDDIESVNVLKGTAAAALYGSLGINGAIMITTKKGKGGDNGVEISINSTNQFQAGFIRIPEVQTEYGMGWNGQYAFKDGKGGGLFDDYGYVYGPKLNVADPNTASGFVEIPQFNSPIDPATGERIPLPWITRSQDNLRKFLRNEMLTTNNVSVAGKTDRGDYRISLTHLFQLGQVPNTELNATTATLAGGLQVTKRIKTEATLSYNRQYSPNYPSAGYGADNYFYNILLWLGPEVDINDLRDYWQPGKKNIQQMTYNYTWYNNPWYLANEYIKAYTNDVIVGQTNLAWDFTDNLKFLIRSGITTNNAFSDRKTPYSFIYYSTGASPNGNYNISRETRFQVISDASLTYSKNFGDDWDLTVSAGGSHRFNGLSRLNSSTLGLNIPGHYNLSNSIAPIRSTNELYEKEVGSVYGYADLGFRRMVYLGITGRNDWTSALQKPNNSFFYPSVSGSFIISEMLKLPRWFSYLKLRASWADVSTDPDPYSTLSPYDIGPRWDGNLSLSRPGVLVSPGLKPNRTISQEYGAELKFWGNRFGADLTYFTYSDENFIVTVPQSPATGFPAVLVNGGRINRKGVELTLTATPLKTKDFRWDANVNLSKAHRYRREYYGGDSIISGIKIGDRVDVYQGWAWQRSPDGKIVTQNGRPQYIDHTIHLGHFDPDLVFGFGSSISWKKLTLGFLIDGRIGGKMYNGVEAKLYEGGSHPGTANKYRDESYAGEATWLVEGVEVTEGTAVWDDRGTLVSDTRKFAPNTTKVKYIDYLFDTYVNGIDESVLYDRTFAKLREVTLTWDMPLKNWRRMPFKAGTISLVGRNLWLWSKVPFMDPDGYTGLSLAEPTYRNLGLNLNLKF